MSVRIRNLTLELPQAGVAAISVGSAAADTHGRPDERQKVETEFTHGDEGTLTLSREREVLPTRTLGSNDACIAERSRVVRTRRTHAPQSAASAHLGQTPSRSL